MQTAADSGVLSWVTSGRCDLVADIRFPSENSNSSTEDLQLLFEELVDEVGVRVQFGREAWRGASRDLEEEEGKGRIPGGRVLKGDVALRAPVGWEDEKFSSESVRRRERKKRSRKRVEEGEEEVEDEDEEEERNRVSIDLDIRFKDLKASVPVRHSLRSCRDVVLMQERQ